MRAGAPTVNAAPGMPPLVRQVRWWVLGLLLCVTIINFVDRQSLSIVAPLLRESLRLSGMAFPLLTGILVDHYSYVPVFSLAAIMPLAGCALLFLSVRTFRLVSIGGKVTS